jgi:hypothetical protein
MPGGLHQQVLVSPKTCRPLNIGGTGECRREYMVMRVSIPALGSQSRGTLASLVASMSVPAANAGGTTCNLQVPGSNPGRTVKGR